MNQIEGEGAGLIIYLDGHEGRGIGLVNKIRAYALQDQGFDTITANEELGLPVDARQWEDSVEILRDLKVTAVRLMSHNPLKSAALVAAGISTTVAPTLTHLTEENRSYLSTKRAELGHDLEI
jgi:3,4-dihydroxy 2-butanone 4-phosphate synthase/GTP cyclohydrolase II